MHVDASLKAKSPPSCGLFYCPKGIAYCEAIENVATQRYGADPYYPRTWVKNPFSDEFNVYNLRDEPYELGELAEKFELNIYTEQDAKNYLEQTKLERKRAESEGIFLGRNCHLFDMVRHWAYQEIRKYRGADLEVWRSAVMQETMAQNAMLNNSLDYNELKGIAKSIARFCWNKDGEAEARFKATQSHRGKLGDSSPGGKARSAQFDNKREQAKALHMQGMKKSQIAKFLGVHRNSVNNWLE